MGDSGDELSSSLFLRPRASLRLSVEGLRDFEDGTSLLAISSARSLRILALSCRSRTLLPPRLPLGLLFPFPFALPRCESVEPARIRRDYSGRFAHCILFRRRSCCDYGQSPVDCPSALRRSSSSSRGTAALLVATVLTFALSDL